MLALTCFRVVSLYVQGGEIQSISMILPNNISIRNFCVRLETKHNEKNIYCINVDCLADISYVELSLTSSKPGKFRWYLNILK